MTLEELQKKLIKNNLDAYIVTRNNMFLGQDVLEEENKVKELSNFDGSAGSLIIFRDKAFLLVDGRYEIQASKQVDTNKITVICTNDSIGSWIHNNVDNPCTFGYDPWCHSISEIDYWNRTLKKHTFKEDDKSILGPRIYNKTVNIFEHDIEYAGISVEEKISYLTEFMLKNELDAFFITECDAVSWLMNLRSDCLRDTPIIRAFALIDKSGEVSLFTSDMQKIETEIAHYKGLNIGLSFNHTPKKIQTIMKDHRVWINNIVNPIQLWKAVKNPVEISGFTNCHLRDGIAVCRFLYWLNKNWYRSDELGIVQKLHELRSNEENFYSDSFATIAAFAENAAIVHYQPNKQTNKRLEADSVLLLDSGAQYYDGTTDITRTIAIGKPSAEIIDSFTQVLKAHIAAASACFPENTNGSCLDTISRAELWHFGKDYKHGTGHGVGHFLNVHEGPNSLSPRANSSPLKADMVTSIEPGYYLENAYGIRIENLYKIIQDEKISMLKFEPLTLVPIDKRLINKYLLNEQEIKWLNDYHELVLSKLLPLAPEEIMPWLKEACSPL